MGGGVESLPQICTGVRGRHAVSHRRIKLSSTLAARPPSALALARPPSLRPARWLRRAAARAAAAPCVRPADSHARSCARVASSRDDAGGSEWGRKELRGWRRTMGTPGAYDCVPWGKVGGRRAQAAPPTLAPNNGAGDIAVHESDEPMTINMTEHGCSIDGTITMKNSVRLLSVSLRTPAGFAPLYCAVSPWVIRAGCAHSSCVWSGRGSGTSLHDRCVVSAHLTIGRVWLISSVW